MMKTTKIAILAAATVAVFAGTEARAASNTVADTVAPYTTTLNAPVDLDFRIRIPAFLFFQVGTAGATVDQVDFTPTPTEVQNSTPVTSSNTVSVTLRGNSGAISITPTNNSGGTGLSNGSGSTINYSTISAAVTAGDAQLAPPTLSNAGGTASNVPVSAGQVTNRTATWSFTYTPGAGVVPEAGDYGTAANGGRVTYTASMP